MSPDLRLMKSVIVQMSIPLEFGGRLEKTYSSGWLFDQFGVCSIAIVGSLVKK
jgi:hypothetical protein